MTCHHRSLLPPLSADDGELLPRVRIGDPRRCRCVLLDDPADHCHQLATGEDFWCDFCRHICAAEIPNCVVIDMTGEHTPASCSPHQTICGDPTTHVMGRDG